MKTEIKQKPTLKNELVVSQFADAHILDIDIATERALNWIRKESKRYISKHKAFWSQFSNELPISVTLIVSPCFDIKEVKTYLENPDYENIPTHKTI